MAAATCSSPTRSSGGWLTAGSWCYKNKNLARERWLPNPLRSYFFVFSDVFFAMFQLKFVFLFTDPTAQKFVTSQRCWDTVSETSRLAVALLPLPLFLSSAFGLLVLSWGSCHHIKHGILLCRCSYGQSCRMRKEARCKTNWCSLWDLHVDLNQSSVIAAARGCEPFHPQTALDYRGNQQVLSSLWSLQVVATGLRGAPRM